MIFFLTDTGSTKTYMIAWVGGLIIGCGFSFYFSYQKYYRPYFQNIIKKVDFSLRKTFFRYSFGTLIAANIGTVLSQIDMQLIILFLDQKAVGYYSNYLSLIGLPFILTGPIIGFLFPVLSELSGR